MNLFLFFVSLMVLAKPDKIEKQGILLNTACAGFGTRCAETGSSKLFTYTFVVQEEAIRLRIEIKQSELEKNKTLYGLLRNANNVNLDESIYLPNGISKQLQLPDNFSIKPGIYRVERKQDVYRIILLE